MTELDETGPVGRLVVVTREPDGTVAVLAIADLDLTLVDGARLASAAPPPAGGLTRAQIEQLRELGTLKAQGILTDAEFVTQKGRVLGA